MIKNPYHWMKQNKELTIELNAHGTDQYEKVVIERLIKLDEKKKEMAEKEKHNPLLEIVEEDQDDQD